MRNLKQVASLLTRRNTIDEKIAALIDRPAISGHVGEWIAQEIFGMTLAKSANWKGSDGRFTCGPLTGQTVNVKWYGKRDGKLDINPAGIPGNYLVLTGPKAEGMTWREQHHTHRWLLTEVFLYAKHRRCCDQ